MRFSVTCNRQRSSLSWQLILGLLTALAPPCLAGQDSVIRPGFESYFANNLSGAEHRLTDCGWRVGEGHIEQQVVYYHFYHALRAEPGIIRLSHPSRCEAPARGANAAFCIEVVQQPSPAVTPETCSVGQLLVGILRKGIEDNQLPFQWYEGRPGSNAFLEDLPFLSRLWLACLPAAGVVIQVLDALHVAFWPLLILLALWHLRRVGNMDVQQLTRLWPLAVGLLGLGALAVALSAMLYPAGTFSMYSADSLQLVGPIGSEARAGPLKEILAPLSGLLLTTNGWEGAAHTFAVALATLTLGLFFVVTIHAVRCARLALTVTLFIAVSPTFLRLGSETPGYLLFCALSFAAGHSYQQYAARAEFGDLARSAIAATLASALISGFRLAPLFLLAYGITRLLRHPQRVSIPAWLGPAAWAVVLTSQVGLVAIGAPGGPPMAVDFLSRHASAGGLLWNYQLVHPVFATLGLLGLVHSITARPVAARLLVIWLVNLAALVVATERFWGGSSYSAAVLLFPGSWLLVAAGVVFLDERLHLSSTGKTLVHLGLVLLVVHHQWLFHSLFGRLLFG